MNRIYNLESLLSTDAKNDRATCLALFALLNLGMVDSLANRSITAEDALHEFYFADNCLFVRKALNDKTADRIMSRGVQLADLFDLLPLEDAEREFIRELGLMKALCLELYEAQRQAA